MSCARVLEGPPAQVLVETRRKVWRNMEQAVRHGVVMTIGIARVVKLVQPALADLDRSVRISAGQVTFLLAVTSHPNQKILGKS